MYEHVHFHVGKLLHVYVVRRRHLFKVSRRKYLDNSLQCQSCTVLTMHRDTKLLLHVLYTGVHAFEVHFSFCLTFFPSRSFPTRWFSVVSACMLPLQVSYFSHRYNMLVTLTAPYSLAYKTKLSFGIRRHSELTFTVNGFAIFDMTLRFRVFSCDMLTCVCQLFSISSNIIMMRP